MDEMHEEEFAQDKDEFDGEDEDGAEEEDFLYESPYEWHFNHLYDDEFEAIKRAGRLRKRVIYPPHLIDLASNDYLRLAHDRKLFNAAILRLAGSPSYAPKASQLVNGYHEIHRDFERFLARKNGFGAAIVIGSGFLGNLALFEALPRRGDLLLIDSEYHASGILAAKTTQGEVRFFEHNNADDLRRQLKTHANRTFVAVEGIYSMSGDMVAQDVLIEAKEAGAVIIIDEAHSCGVIGHSLDGVFDYYSLDTVNVVKLGTLGKAYGSYGAYILANRSIIEFLVNRAKPIIYSTAPSLFDIAYAHEAAQHVHTFSFRFRKQVEKAIAIAAKHGYQTESLILPIEFESNRKVMSAQKRLMKEGFLVGAIRPPTVNKPQLRVILRETPPKLERFFKTLKNL
ncbi:8-amino-7-oxononanoate synthase [Campylobacterota bacterium]|nr:8-amino-7-oxononanoate synthase [Campylobacterota bacterium]